MSQWEEWLRLLATGLDAGWMLPLRVTAIAIAAWIASRLASRVIRRFRESIAARMSDAGQVKRAETLGRVFRYLATVLITLFAGVLILSELGVSVAPFIGAAGVAGLAVGFGAQSLVKDYFTGFFLLLENQITRGDVVSIAEKTGLVEDLTLRYVRLRDYDGNVHFVPNGLISTVTNMGQTFACAVVDVGVAYREDIDQTLQVMRRVADEMRTDPQHSARILEPVEMVGVEGWADSAVTLRCRFKVRPLEQWTVRREYLRRLKIAFDAEGIEIPFPHVTLYAGVDRQGRAPALPLELRWPRS